MRRALALSVVCYAIILFVYSTSARAEDRVVIVNKENTGSIRTPLVKRIYSGEVSSWPENGPVAVIDLPDDNELRASFAASVLGKTTAQLKAVWAQKVFSGRAMPPKVVSTEEEVKRIVASNRNAIGYISASKLDNTVRAVVQY